MTPSTKAKIAAWAEILWYLAAAISFVTAFTTPGPDGGVHWTRGEHNSLTIVLGCCYILLGIACRSQKQVR